MLLEADRIGQGGSSRASGVFASEATHLVSRSRAEGRPPDRPGGLRGVTPRVEGPGRHRQAARNQGRARAARCAADRARSAWPTSSARREATDRAEAGLEASWLSPSALARQTTISGHRRHPPSRLGRGQSCEAAPGFCVGRNQARRDLLREIAGAAHHVRPQAGGRGPRERIDHDAGGDRLHGRTDRPLQAAQTAFAVRRTLRRDDRTARRPRSGRRSANSRRSCAISRRRRISCGGPTIIAPCFPAPIRSGRRSVCETRSSSSAPVS